MSKETIDHPDSKPRPFLSPIPRLRIGSTLVTQRGVLFRVREAVVMVAQSGGESPSLVVDRIRDGQSVELFMTVGILANLTRGATHSPGTGVRIDWARAPRRPLINGHCSVAQRPPSGAAAATARARPTRSTQNF
jgi:hypothetical protein